MRRKREFQTIGSVLSFLLVIGVLTSAFPVSAAPKHIDKKGHTPSGLIDSKGNVLYVESSITPEVDRTAPITSPASTFSTQSTTAPADVSLSAESSPVLGPNLIQNPSLESADASGLPVGWRKGGYGTNTRTLTYPVTPAQDGSKAARVSITSYASGDAKWYFTPVSVTPGQTYQFSDFSFGNVSSEIDAQLKMNDGTFRYIVLARPGPSSSYQNTTAQFTVPSGAVSVTIFHVINQVGTLTVDNYSLNQVGTETPPASQNMVPNGDFETAGSSGLPSGWNKGGWGTNTRTLSYPVTGVGGSKAARVSITSYTSGDAKWYFTPRSLASGFYTYADSYQSNIPSIVVAQYHHTDGTFTYDDLATAPPASTFMRQSVNFAVPAGTQDVTVFRVIKGVGTLTLDNVSIVPNTNAASEAFPNGAVTLSLDDGWLSQYQNAIPSMNAHGFKGTFYMVSRRFADNGFPGFVSKAQIQDMFRMGHEIGAHTQTHPHLTQLTPAEQQQQISGSRQDLLAMNVGPINAFAYPYGEYDSTTMQIVKNAGFSSARSTIDGYANAISDHYQLPRQGVINTTTVAQIKGWIDQAIAQKSWLIIAFHEVNTSGNALSITPANFNQVMDYLAQKGVPVLTIAQGMQRLGS